jgi:orotate phosphoribosyltransferase
MGNKTKKELIEKFKEIGVVVKRRVRLKHAGASDVYFDVKKAYGHPDALDLICRSIKEKISEGATSVAAAGYGGLPLAAALSVKYGLKLVLVREKPKEHGRNVWVDGHEPNAGDGVWIVDDVLTTGNSIRQILKVLENAKVLGATVVVARGRADIGVPLSHILTAEELLQ